MDARERLRVELIARQGALADGPFALMLGTSRSHWVNVRRARRGLSDALARRALQLWPDLRPLITDVVLGVAA